MLAHKISAAIITFNEEKNITRTLEKLSWCNEIVVVDSFSEDKTLEICARFGAKVFYKEFNGYGEQKNFLVEKCNNDWILSVDADEVLSDELIEEIKTEFRKDLLPYNAYFLNRRHVYLGKIFKYGYLKNTPILRLFNKQTANFTNKKVHETLEYKGKRGRFKNVFYHYTANTIQQINLKKNRYATLVSEEYFKKKRRVNLFLLFFKYPFAFLKEYFIRGNILNGYEGYVWSTYIAEYTMLKYLKLREKNKNIRF